MARVYYSSGLGGDQGRHTQATNETECLENDLSPEDEHTNESSNFDSFATTLETYTGLGQTPFNVTLNCESTPCIINPNGAAIWEARQHFYLNNMMSNTNGSKTTLDGCLCYSQDSTQYQSCMTEVRENMIIQLDTVLLEKFKEIVENNCTVLFQPNCVTE